MGIIGIVQFFVDGINASLIGFPWFLWVIIGMSLLLWGVLKNANNRIIDAEKKIKQLVEGEGVEVDKTKEIKRERKIASRYYL